MSLDFALMKLERIAVADFNYTHNITQMAEVAGIYDCLWRPDEHGFKIASDIIPLLESGVEYLRGNKDLCQTFDPPNKWGSYETFLPWVEKVLAACKEYPDAEIEVWR